MMEAIVIWTYLLCGSIFAGLIIQAVEDIKEKERKKTMEDPNIDVSKLDLKDGDILLIKLDEDTPAEFYQEVAQLIKEALEELGKDNKVVILPNTINLEVETNEN